MQTSVKGLIILGLLIGQLIAASAQDITCPAAYVEGCDDWTWSNQAQWTSLCNQYATLDLDFNLLLIFQSPL
jgi:hypothetical protein